MRDALGRHRRAIAAIFVASWGWALLWPQGTVLGHSGGGGFASPQTGERLGQSYRYETRGWGVNGVFLVGTNTWKVQRGRGDLATPLPPEEARALIEQHDPRAFGREGWFVDWRAFALACLLGTLYSVVSSIWWVGLRKPVPPGTAPARVLAGVLGMAIWPMFLAAPVAWSMWRRLGSPAPQTLTVIDPELSIMATVYLVSVIAVLLGRPRPAS